MPWCVQHEYLVYSIQRLYTFFPTDDPNMSSNAAIFLTAYINNCQMQVGDKCKLCKYDFYKSDDATECRGAYKIGIKCYTLGLQYVLAFLES